MKRENRTWQLPTEKANGRNCGKKNGGGMQEPENTNKKGNNTMKNENNMKMQDNME